MRPPLRPPQGRLAQPFDKLALRQAQEDGEGHPYNACVPNKSGRRNPRAQQILRSLPPQGADEAGPALFLLVGLPGVGKTTFARRLRTLTGAAVLESDRLRSVLFGAPVFSQRESGMLFRAVLSAAAELLGERRPVIIDATNLSEADRRPFCELAGEAGAPLSIFALDAPVAVVEARLEARLSNASDCSYADIAVYHRMRGRVEPISREHRRIDTSDQAAVEAALTSTAAAYWGRAAAAGKGDSPQ